MEILAIVEIVNTKIGSRQILDERGLTCNNFRTQKAKNFTMPSKEKKNRVGRPERYPGEEATRLSALMRPRYKKALEMLANYRQTSVSEAAEFAVAFMAQRVEVGGAPLLDYVRPPDESFNRYLSATVLKTDRGDSRAVEEEDSEAYAKEIDQVLKTPNALRSPAENFVANVLGFLPLMGTNSPYYFTLEKLKWAILEDWKEGHTVEESISAIGKVDDYLNEKYKGKKNS